MYKLYSTELYRFTFVLNAWPVDESARSQQIHYTDLPVVILTPQITVPPLLASIFLALVSAQFRLADQTTGERCPSELFLQRFDQHVKRHIPIGTIFYAVVPPIVVCADTLSEDR